ncbi:PREDICTED: uncharacterized protein LOC104789161 [Camelina sativa]|uniref:Uncharacterized protein LOC104789161 n=1 Tax=Camelina sativa TaxID=90675 RepID=A0ABM0ZBD6_CAMSA|nr:PREDICTED: uncharacterized protein LOC104789161 [Camelina sativa]
MERGQRKGTPSLMKSDTDKEIRKSDKQEQQCAECEGFGHYKSECPNNKRKSSLQCYGCKGYGHTKFDCPSRENKQKSYITWSESDSDEEVNKGEVLNSFLALLGVIEEDEEDDVAISSIDMEAWFAVEDGWSHPTEKNEEGEMVPKHRKKWTVKEKAESKHNSQALSVIFKSLPRAIFNQVQGCEAAKEAWDILVVMFEGTSRVKRTRLDNLASDFENLHMTETESVADYSSRLSGIAQEAVVLGKRYKDKKLVKKFLRSLPNKFHPHRSATDVSLNSDELKYNQEVADEEKVGLLVKKYFRKMERGQRKGTPSLMKSDTDKEIRKSDKQEQQCAECEGFGHYKSECPNNKRKSSLQCYGCKGYGHTKFDCPSRENKQKSYITWSESDSDEEVNKGEVLNSFLALLGVIEEDEEDDVVLETKDLDEKVQSDSDGEEADLSVEDQIELLIKTVVQKTQDNTQLTSERDILQLHIAMITKELSEEKAKTLRLEKQLEEQMKNIRMLNKGTKDLDTLLSAGRSSNLKRGLGYQGTNTNTTTQFVKGMGSKPKLNEKKFSTTTRLYDQCSVNQNPRIPRMRVHPELDTRPPYASSGFQQTAQRPVRLSRRRGCCLVQRGEFYPAVRRNTQGYVRKDDLYCQVAFTAEKTKVDQAKWYFDSGCSRHMTGALDNLSYLEDVAGGRVTFGDGGKGTIRGKGTTSGDSQPHLRDVFLVEGLKANLISISQLCDEGLDVTFTKKGCKAVDQQGSVRLRGRRSGNNCYMWKSSMQCFNTTTELDTELWHQKLGHLNIRTMMKLANQEVVRGIPKLKGDPHFTCGPCNKGKQVKASHGPVADIRTSHALQLVHMDLMGPIQVQSISGRRFIFVMIKSEKCSVQAIRSDHGGEFQNDKFDQLCGHQGIVHQYSAPRTPEQNGVVERKN